MTDGSSHALSEDRESRPRDDNHDYHPTTSQAPVDVDAVNASAIAAAVQDLNERNAYANKSIDPFQSSATTTRNPHEGLSLMTLTPPSATDQIQFRTNTTAPSPPPPDSTSQDERRSIEEHRFSSSPLRGTGDTRRLSNDLPVTTRNRNDSLSSDYQPPVRPGLQSLQSKHSFSNLRPISRSHSFKKAIANSIGIASANSSAAPSPVISALGDVTPLPSPLLMTDSPGPWKRLGFRPPSRDSASPPNVPPDSVLVTASGESIAAALAHQSKRKVYAGLVGNDGPSNISAKTEHVRNRSISEYIPDPLALPRRQVTVSGTHRKPGEGNDSLAPEHAHMRREPHLSEVRGITQPAKPPTPPPSESSQSNEAQPPARKPHFDYFEARGRGDGKLRRWRAVKVLGQGTFSRVVLATSQMPTEEEKNQIIPEHDGPATPTPEIRHDRKTLVAIKICEHGPKGGASEDRIEMSLKRELEIMQSISHPCLVHLKAFSIEPERALLVLSYCPGGDLFDVATKHRECLTPSLLRRMFSELVGAVRYLHERRIVHRDIKLENVLVNLPDSEMTDTSRDWQNYPHSVITVTDLGLSRRIADDEKLETRCGSEDYAAPEVIMGQLYDGRATDAWSLGVLLYALLESRLPFDPHPSVMDGPGGAANWARLRSRTSHRIARVEWRWIEYGVSEENEAEAEGDHEADLKKFQKDGLVGAMEIVEGLLKRTRSRWPLEKVAGTEWVQGGIQVAGGIKFRDEKLGEEVL